MHTLEDSPSRQVRVVLETCCHTWRSGTTLKYRNHRKEQLALGDVLALDRTRLANERTFLAYLRAAVMIAVSSVSIFKLLPDEPILVAIAWVMLPISILLATVGTIRSMRLAGSLRQLEETSTREV